MDWTDPIASKPIEEWEDDMSSLAAAFVAWMLKQSLRGRLPLTLKYQAAKSHKWSGPNEEAHNSPSVINVDSSECALDALLALEVAA